VPGTENAVKSGAEAHKIAKRHRIPGDRESRDGRRRSPECASFTMRRNLPRGLEEAQGEARSAFGDASVFLEKYLPRAAASGSANSCRPSWKLCCIFMSVIVRCSGGTKVVEVDARQRICHRAFAPELCDAAVRLARKANYRNAGTVEFLYDVDAQTWYFIEVNPADSGGTHGHRSCDRH
jgi:pyruvate carboxylase